MKPPDYCNIDNDMVAQANDLTTQNAVFLSANGDQEPQLQPSYHEIPINAYGVNEFGEKVDWNFVGLRSDFHHDVIYFNSRFAWQQYKVCQKAASRSEAFNKALELQRRGIGIPLLEMKYSKFSRKHMTMLKYVAPPVSENRLFNKAIDKFEYCEVRKKNLGMGWAKYVMEFKPRPKDPSKNFTVIMFEHGDLPLVDVTPYKTLTQTEDTRYRWIKSYESKYIYNYELTMLRSDQPSLADGVILLNPETALPNERALPKLKKGEWLYDPKCPKLEKYIGETFGKFSNDVDKSILPKISIGIKVTFNLQEYLPPDAENTQSVNAVDDNTLALLCMSGVFDRGELENKRL